MDRGDYKDMTVFNLNRGAGTKQYMDKKIHVASPNISDKDSVVLVVVK